MSRLACGISEEVGEDTRLSVNNGPEHQKLPLFAGEWTEVLPQILALPRRYGVK